MTITTKNEENLKHTTFTHKVKFYASICLGTTALLSVFAFLFLIPFIVDPSVTTIMANFNVAPVACTTVKHVYTEGLSNCTWTSCKEGCTSVTPRCHQIYINYSEIPYAQWKEGKNTVKDIKWIAGPVKFFINTEGCGYPPRVNCTLFVKQYGWKRENEIFPCFYSKRYPNDRTVAQFDWNYVIKNLILAISIPNVLFGLSVGILSYWHCWPFSFSYEHRPNILSTTYAIFDNEPSANLKYK